MRGLLRKLQADTCNTVIQAVALVRPGASGSGMKQHFIDRRRPRAGQLSAPVHGAGPGRYLWRDDLPGGCAQGGPRCGETALDEADTLRRAMSKRGPREMARNMKRFLEGAAARGVPEHSAHEIWELIANFASYAYCKAHAATYGELAYQCAWLKAHYPAEFFTAVLANGGGFYAPPVYVSEAHRQGVPVLPPDVNRSALSYAQEGDAVRTGFAQITDLTEKTARTLEEARGAGPFRDLEDLLDRVRLSPADGEALCQAGALDTLPAAPGAPPLTRPMQLWRLRNVPERDTTRLFVAEAAPVDLPVLPDIAPRLRADFERSRLGQPLSSPLLRYHAAACWETPLIASCDLPRYEGREITAIGTIIAERRLPLHNGRGVMKFLTVEDAWGVFEAVLFPETYRRFGHLAEPGCTHLYIGVVRSEHDDAVLEVARIIRAG